MWRVWLTVSFIACPLYIHAGEPSPDSLGGCIILDGCLEDHPSLVGDDYWIVSYDNSHVQCMTGGSTFCVPKKTFALLSPLANPPWINDPTYKRSYPNEKAPMRWAKYVVHLVGQTMKNPTLPPAAEKNQMHFCVLGKLDGVFYEIKSEAWLAAQDKYKVEEESFLRKFYKVTSLDEKKDLQQQISLLVQAFHNLCNIPPEKKTIEQINSAIPGSIYCAFDRIEAEQNIAEHIQYWRHLAGIAEVPEDSPISQEGVFNLAREAKSRSDFIQKVSATYGPDKLDCPVYYYFTSEEKGNGTCLQSFVPRIFTVASDEYFQNLQKVWRQPNVKFRTERQHDYSLNDLGILQARELTEEEKTANKMAGGIYVEKTTSPDYLNTDKIFDLIDNHGNMACFYPGDIIATIQVTDGHRIHGEFYIENIQHLTRTLSETANDISLSEKVFDLAITRNNDRINIHVSWRNSWDKPSCMNASKDLFSKNDMNFIESCARTVLDESRVAAGAKVGDIGPNVTGNTIIRPGGRNDYPAFWIRDYAMSLDMGMITKDEQRHALFLTAKHQPDKEITLPSGSILPPGSIPDHIGFGDVPIFFPGILDDYRKQGGPQWGKIPCLDDEFFFIHMAAVYARRTASTDFLQEIVNGKPLLQRLEEAYAMPPAHPDTGIVYTTEETRGVNFGFFDTVVNTGDLLFASLLKYQASNELAAILEKANQSEKAATYREKANMLKSAISATFATPSGFLKAATGISAQPDVWGTAYAVYAGALPPAQEKSACEALARALKEGTIAWRGQIRHVPTNADYSPESAWEKCYAAKNTYQNGAYWATPTGWVCYAAAQADTLVAQSLARDYFNELWAGNHQKGETDGYPWECMHPDNNHRQNPIYLASVSVPLAAFQRIEAEIKQ